MRGAQKKHMEELDPKFLTDGPKVADNKIEPAELKKQIGKLLHSK